MSITFILLEAILLLNIAEREIYMNKHARIVGVLFLLSTCTYLIGSGMIDPVLERSDFLTNMHLDETKVFLGVFLELINAITVVGIAMFLYPILKQHNEAFTMGYLGSRIIESVLLIISATVPLVLIVLKNYMSTTNAEVGSLVVTGNLLVEAYYLFFQMAMLVLSLGSLLLCVILYRFKLVPAFLSIIGMIGYVALLLSSCLEIVNQPIGPVLYIPGAIFELVFPIWLIVKGFRLPKN